MNDACLANFLRGKVQFYIHGILQCSHYYGDYETTTYTIYEILSYSHKSIKI